MPAQRRPWIPVLAIALAVGGLSAIAVLALRSEPLADEPTIETTSFRDPASIPADASSTKESGPSGRDDLSPAALRESDEFDPLALPDRAERRRLADDGRGVYCGVVSLPDGTACPAATVFFRGKAVAVADELGRYRCEVEHPFGDHDPGGGLLAAVKPGVGAGVARLEQGIARLDIFLTWQSRLAGTAIETGTRKPVAGARIEMLSFYSAKLTACDALFRQETVSSTDGSFEFVGFTPGEIDLRGTADDRATDGWIPVRVEYADRLDVALELEPIIRVSGQFAPWPPHDLLESGAAVSARVKVTADEGRTGGPRNESIDALVDAGGRFEASLPSTSKLDLLLVAGAGALWHETVDVLFRPRDLDLGRIELDEPVVLTGFVDVPAGILELGCELRVQVKTNRGLHELRFPIGPDGRFRATPLPAGSLACGVAIGEGWLIPNAMVEAEFDFGYPAPQFQALDAGTTLDLGRLVPRGFAIAGRITLPEDDLESVIVALICDDPSHESDLAATCGAHSGKYVLSVSRSCASDFARAFESEARPKSRFWILGMGEGVRGEFGLDELPLIGTAIRSDVRLSRALMLEGVLIDSLDRPLTDWLVQLEANPDGESGEELPDLVHLEQTRSDGSFCFRGLRDSTYRVSAFQVAGLVDDLPRYDLGVVHPGAEQVKLVVKRGE